MRQKMIWAAILAGASFYIFAFLVGDKSTIGQTIGITEIRSVLSTSISIVATMAIGIGVINLFAVHGNNVLKKKKGWPFSIIVFLAFALVLAALFWQSKINSQTPSLNTDNTLKAAVNTYQDACKIEDANERDAAIAAIPAEQITLVENYYASKNAYQFQPRVFVVEYILNPLARTVMALLGFYITFAAYRAFRIRSLEATIMMISAAILIIGSDMIGGWLSVQANELFGSEGLNGLNMPAYADFFNKIVNSGMQRGLMIGIGIATIAAALRTLLGYERGLIEVRQSGE